jgi:hypothetical protein
VIYKARWGSRGIQPLDCLPFVRSFMGQWLALLDRYHLQSLPSTSINVVASGLVISSSLERVPRRLEESSIDCMHPLLLPSIDDGEKEHGMSKRYRKTFLYLVSFLDEIPIMWIGLSSVLACLLLAWRNISTFSLDIIKPSLARTFPSAYEAQWISRGIQSLACLPFVIENISLSL